ncbi:hypothetical protein [Bacillus sp. FJAT-42376]|uniref:hypothetical protein n=1 Tax=Bacillus sp. FJAT-42376 TaxID=2014076 RepID=UPI000F50CA4E|nr:hypothetical protein [Bacillus sp. FJAT-42376]
MDFDYLNSRGKDFYQLVYARAWSGKTMVYYMVPNRNENIYLLSILTPVKNGDENQFLNGQCACLQKQEMECLNIPLQTYQAFG